MGGKAVAVIMINKEEFIQKFPSAVFDEPMSSHTTFKIGGPADVFIEASNVNELKSLIGYCREKDIPYMVIGNGSNMLVSDKGLRAAVIKIGKNMSKIETNGETVTAEAGALMSTLANVILKAELTGFENFSGIPGSLGGGIYMNAGAYGSELKDIIETVTYMDKDGEIYTRKNNELDLSYRHSMFESGEYVILSSKLKLKKGNYDEIKAAMQECSKKRNDKQPISMPSAGSTFKRPEGYFAGKLIQDSGLQGYSIGGAQVSEKHAGFIVNTGGAAAADVLALIKYVQDTVEEKFGVRLEPEVKLIGER